MGVMFLVLAAYCVVAAVYCYVHCENLAYKLGGVITLGVGAVLGFVLCALVLQYWWRLRAEP